MSSWEWTVNTGNPAQDQAMLAHHQQQAAAQGMTLDVSPSPTGGFILRARPANAPPPAQAGFAPPQQQGFAPPPQAASPYGAPPAGGSPYGAPPPQAASPYGAPAPAGAPPAMAYGAPAGFSSGSSYGGGEATATDTGALGAERIKYLRKVYGLLTAAALIAVLTGYGVLELMPTENIRIGTKVLKAPMLVAYMLAFPVVDIGIFGALFVATIVASWVSKVKVLNIIGLFGVAALMGLDMSAMVWVATVKAGFGVSMVGSPVLAAGVSTAAVFLGATMYVFISKKDFSYLGAMLSIGGWVIFGACLLTFVFHSEIFALAVASAGALLSALGLLYMTSYILKHSDMDDPVGDALIFLVKLRNLFMFLLRIFMSSRD